MKITLHAYWRQWKWDDEPSLVFSQYDVSRDVNSDSDKAEIYAGSFEIDCPFETPPTRNEITGEFVKSLRKEQGQHQAQITKIEEKIQQLLCIENKVES